MNFALGCSERAVGTFGEDKSALYLSAATDVGMKILHTVQISTKYGKN